MQFPRFKSQYDWRDLLERHVPQMLPRPKAGFLVNWLGVVTDIAIYSGRQNYEAMSEQIFSKLPIPSDGHHVDADEYGGLLMAIENRANKNKLVIVEIGAAWGPWISAGAIVAKRMGIKEIDIIGVEADSRKVEYMRQHMAHNNLSDDSNINITYICGAIWTSDAKIYFGADTNFTDYAAAATDQLADTDYLGRPVEFAEMQGFTLDTIIGERDTVDYIAMDIQGSEYEILQSSIDLLNSKVRFLSVGTHSPAIHGNIIELFFKNGWHVLWDKYPEYDYDLNKLEFTAMTTYDGELILANTKLLSENAS